MSKDDISKELLDLCNKVTAKRARTVIDHILKYGQITTDELYSLYGYNHPPRAVRDVRDRGIPIKTIMITSPSDGRKIASYKFDEMKNIKKGKIGGRKAFSKQFKDALIDKYESKDCITNETWEDRYLQIDHRVPYEIAGDDEHDENNLDKYMLLHASTQRAKSWSCEHCDNFLNLEDISNCLSCFWAYPENYQHVALKQVRRTDIIWSEDSLEEFYRLEEESKSKNISIQELIKQIIHKHYKNSK